jgi:DNA-binding NtrC family response regulator
LELLDRQRYNMALIDFRMPQMNGVELYERMRGQQPDLIGVFLTGYPTIDTVYPAIDAGVQRVLAKPAASEEILAVVEEFVGKP